MYETVVRGFQTVCNLLTNWVLKTMDSIGVKARGRPLTRSNQRRPHVGVGIRAESLSKDTVEFISCGGQGETCDLKIWRWNQKSSHVSSYLYEYFRTSCSEGSGR